MPDQTAPEASMDEILASIRKIISDDDAPSGKPPEPDDTLRLTDRVDPVPAKAPSAMTPDMLQVAPTAAPPIPEEPLVGEPAAAVAASSFEKLSQAAGPGPAPSIAMPPAGRSLEDLTRDMLRPMLKAWLDENLPGIVQARVDEEVERIARRRTR